MTLTWRDIDNHALACEYSEAIAFCRVEDITPTVVGSLLAAGVLRDDREVEAYDEWEQTGIDPDADRYDHTLDARMDDIEEDQEDAFEAFELIVERLEVLEAAAEEDGAAGVSLFYRLLARINELVVRVDELESSQYFLRPPQRRTPVL